MKKLNYDIVVVGGGPAGSMTAWRAAKAGAKVLMIEKRQEIGSSLRCAEGISHKGLYKVGITPDPKWVSTEVAGARLVSPGGHLLQIDEKSAGNEVGMVLERHMFDKYVASEAARAGAEIMLKTSAVDVIKENGKVTGVKAVSYGEPLTIKAGCVVAADGYESQVARWAGIDSTLKPTDITTCFQYRMTNIKHVQDYCEFIIGSAAPGGYVWIFPKGGDTANVGIGVMLSKLKKPGEVKGYLDKYIAKDPRLNCGQPVEAIAGAVSISPPLEKCIADGLMIVGDAARIIDPITGGGIANGLLQGMHAGNVLGRCAQAKDFTEANMQEFEDLWRKDMENRLWRNWMAKEKFVTLSDKTLDSVIQTIAEVGVEKVTVYNLLMAIKEKHPELVKEFEEFL
ncbi:MAG: Digeranylgeranylglycerophospholipid reductase [Methanomassiliicoccales archaeon PtaU1.Bin124]|nr:MAG: Digeranylgeranylglycerophospholipid reductase [Methanomassiliicoccales archaeon PtaU1.Bin124]